MNNNWEISTLDQLAEVIDSRHKTPQYSNEGLPMVRVVDVTGGKLELSNTNKVSQDIYDDFSKGRDPEIGDLIISRVGSYGNISYVNSKDKFCLGQNTALIVPKGINWRYLYYQLISPLIKNQIEFLVVGAVQKTISLKSIKSFELMSPPLPEQKAIAHILGTLDDKIELNRQMNQTLEAMAQALFKSWFVDFDPVMDNALASNNEIPDELQAMAEKRQLVPDSKKLISTNPELAAKFPSSFVFNEALGKWIPKGWEVKSFGELIETTIGGDWGKEVPDDKHTEELKIVRGTDIPSLANCDLGSAPTRFVELKKLKTRKLEVGDIVIEVSGGSPTQSTGRSIRLTENILERLGGIAEPASFCRRLKPINEKFSVLCGEHLTYIYGIGKMWEYQNQSTGIANFQTPYFLEAEMVIVPSDEKVLDSFYSQVSILKDKATSNENIILTQLRDRLLPELISGRVRVKEGMEIMKTYE